ncbi:MAG: DUF1211 domain-containing protein [Rhodanobacter denitrificans]|uniref:DUF1211 domain-containing protein n=1 Tax=Rhodanobacter denitrificans TaxID=666685 RepID=A0A2W5MLT7_9GAMM|nr:MAG: DUF1211 domain-containing protein [Rhodanobacter denitrificans]
MSVPTAPPNAVPTDPAVRGRSAQPTRLEAFVDAAFAFALTLLVISIDTIPESIGDLTAALKGVPAFALSFAVIAMFWYQHARWSRRYGSDRLAVTLLSLVLVFLVLIYVYPLKIVFSAAMTTLSGGWLPSTTRIDSLADLVLVYRVYGLGWSAMWLCIVGLYWVAARDGEPTPERAADIAANVAVGGVAIATGLVSVLIAGLLPAERSWVHGLPGIVYVAMNLAWPASQVAARRAARMAAA